MTSEARVALVKGKSRYENVRRALELIEEDVESVVSGKKRVLIKPNFVSTERQLAATHVEAVGALLDSITKFYSGKILIGEGPAAAPAIEGYINYGYLDLKRDYDVEFIDLNEDEGIWVTVFDANLQPLEVRISKTVYESDCRISVTPMKTHDAVVMTASLKNMVVGALIDHDKSRIHQGYRAINLNLYKLAKVVPPHLSVIDGFAAMEGDGPIMGSPVDLRIAIVSRDFLAADVVALTIMGFSLNQVGYLYYANKAGLGIGDLNLIKIVGESIKNVRRKFKPHTFFEEQLNWRIPEEILSSVDKKLV